MTLIDTFAPPFDRVTGVGPAEHATGSQRPGPAAPRRCAARTGPVRPERLRPGGAPLRHRGAGVPMSRTPHRPQPITPTTTVVLALIAAGITVWLGLVAQFGAATPGAAPAVPERLGVVRVQSGENLQHLAARVAPDAPAGEVVERIRELNELTAAQSVALDAGQPLITPIG